MTPATATLPKGADMQLGVSVTRTGVVNQAVEWSVTGNTSTGTYVTDAGKVHIAKDETGTTVTVKAASVADPAKSGQCVVTVQA